MMNPTPQPSPVSPARISRTTIPVQPTARTAPTLREPVIETEPLVNENKKGAPPVVPPRVYKPAQLKLPPRPREEEWAENETKKIPANENENEDAGALGLLREEASSEGKSISRPPTSSERRAPISNLGEFAGFDETLTQLKRDLKAFNESVDMHSRKKGKGA